MLRNNTFNLIKYILDSRHHVTGCKSDHTKSISVQPSCPAFVVKHLGGFCMLFAINFDDEANRQAAEVCEIRPQRKLASEAMAVYRSAP
ncbi:MAG TPA: hypothetical protein VHU18_10015 [Rhizomicrobium sp.]|nr:hypothetical protein [Rhizomicrobium sp.]